MWDLPGPGLEPVSPALAGGFLTTEPPGKPRFYFLFLLKKFLCGGVFPGGLVVRIQRFHCCDPGSIPGRETEISQAAQRIQKKIPLKQV